MRIPSTLENLIRWLYPTYHLRHQGNLDIARDCYFDRCNRVLFGKDVFVNRKCQFHVGYGNSEIIIGDKVWIGMDTCFVCPTHYFGNEEQRAGTTISKSIVVESGVWIGARVTILPGVKIGKGAIVAAGSVVANNLEANCLWGGGCQLS